MEQGYFTSQITPVVIAGKAGVTTVSVDEEPLKVSAHTCSRASSGSVTTVSVYEEPLKV